ncbi:MAG: hypothetical protein WC412_05340 [Candidatus Omnitrophota bacterium]
MKKLIKVIVWVIVVLGILLLAKNFIAKTAVSGVVKKLTGLTLNIDSLNVGVFKTAIDIKGLKLHNPAGFKDRLMMNMPRIYVDYDLGAFFKNKVHLEDIKINLEEFVVVKNEKGELNLNSLRVVQDKKQTKKEGTKKKESKLPDLKIDVLDLRIGKVIYKDYSKGAEPSIQEFNVNINEQYENINDPYVFTSLIIVKALMNTSIASLANFDLGPLKNAAGSSLGKAKKLAGDAAAKSVEAGKKIEKKLEGATKGIGSFFKSEEAK